MGFESCHPAVSFIYFASVLFCTVSFDRPIFLAISFVSAFAYSIKRNGVRALIFNILLLPCVLIFALYYSSYTHFGVTVLRQNFIGNNMTLESLLYGLVLGCTVSSVFMWFSCIHSMFTTDKVVYLFGRVSPRLSLFLSILIRMLPRLKAEAGRINAAQRGIGCGTDQGSVFHRLKNAVRIFSMLITWMIDSFAHASDSMQCRGSALRGRTAFSIYRFDNRDRAYVIAMFCCITLTLMAMLLGQTHMIYDPKLIVTPLTGVSVVLCIGYFLMCMMPMMLDIFTEYRFFRARKAI